MRSTSQPESVAKKVTPRPKAKANFGPCNCLKTPKVIIFDAGPAIKKAIAAPADRPFWRPIAAIGVAPEAQT